MRVAFIGPPQSGKSTIFAAVAETGGSHVDLSRPDQVHLIVVKVPDDRLDWLTEQYQPKKSTLAELEFIDLLGSMVSGVSARIISSAWVFCLLSRWFIWGLICSSCLIL